MEHTVAPTPDAMTAETAAPSAPVHRVRFADEEGGSAVFCVFLGLVSLVIGLFFLVIEPGETVSGYDPVDGFSTRSVVNLQRLAVGQTLTICGAVFLAAALRPRR